MADRKDKEGREGIPAGAGGKRGTIGAFVGRGTLPHPELVEEEDVLGV